MTSISWCVNPDGTPGETWNPIRARNRVTGKRGWYCEPVHLGCKYCYAGDLNAKRGDSGGTGLPYKPGHRDDVEIYLDEKTLLAPLHWRKPRTIFPCSMTDPHGWWVPDAWLDKIKAVQALTPQHTYIELTKRPARRREYLDIQGRTAASLAEPHIANPHIAAHWPLTQERAIAASRWPLPNVWGLASCSRQEDLDKFAPAVLATPLAKRGLSLEPLLGEVNLTRVRAPASGDPARSFTFWDVLRGHSKTEHPVFGGGGLAPTKIDFIIVGGLNGPEPTEVGPIRSAMQQCQAAGVPVFVKQLGTRPFEAEPLSAWPDHIEVRGDGFGRYLVRGLTNRKGEDPADWPADLRVREWPE